MNRQKIMNSRRTYKLFSSKKYTYSQFKTICAIINFVGKKLTVGKDEL